MINEPKKYTINWPKALTTASPYLISPSCLSYSYSYFAVFDRAIAEASFNVLSPNTIKKIYEFTFNARKIDIVATGSIAEMKNPNSKLVKNSKG